MNINSSFAYVRFYGIVHVQLLPHVDFSRGVIVMIQEIMIEISEF
jgi:hypothetical protein